MTLKSATYGIVSIVTVSLLVIVAELNAADSPANEDKSKTVTAVVKAEPQTALKPAPESSMKLIPGARIYRDNCSICHGDKGDGNTRASGGLRPPPRDFTTVEAAMELNRERMIISVAEGRPGTGMMAHKDRLTKKEIDMAVDFIRGSFMRKVDAEDVTVKNIKGRKIYTKNCSVCHGDSGSTAVWAQSGLNPPPRDFTAPETARELSRARMLNSVTNGRPGTGMMPFTSKLDAQQIEDVVDYIREAFLRVDKDGKSLDKIAIVQPAARPGNIATAPMDSNHARMRQNPHANMPAMQRATNQASPPATKAGPHAGGMPTPGMMAMNTAPPAIVDADMSLPMPGALVGDIEAGRKFFMGNCFTCHGVTGEGDGPRAHFNIPRPRNFTSEDSRRAFNRVKIFDSVTNGKVGTVMPAWSKVLTPQQIANVVEFVFQEFIQSGKSPKDNSTTKKKAS